MKKLLLAIVIIAGFGGYSHAGPMGNDTLFVWRASHTETADSQVLISSEGTIAFGGVSIGSGSNTSSWIYIYDAQKWAAGMDTVTTLDCTNNSTQAVTNQGGLMWLPVKISSGLFYTKVGNCKADIFWDVLQRKPEVLPIRAR